MRGHGGSPPARQRRRRQRKVPFSEAPAHYLGTTYIYIYIYTHTYLYLSIYHHTHIYIYIYVTRYSRRLGAPALSVSQDRIFKIGRLKIGRTFKIGKIARFSILAQYFQDRQALALSVSHRVLPLPMDLLIGSKFIKHNTHV